MNKKTRTIIFILAAIVLLIAGTLYFSGYFKQIKIDTYERKGSDFGQASKTTPPVSDTISEGADTRNTDSNTPKNEGSMQHPEQTDIKEGQDAESKPQDAQTDAPVTIVPKDTGNEEFEAIQNWLERKIEEHKDEIDELDLKDFRAIITKLDQPYIKQLAVDGFTGEEQGKLKAHLLERLTDSEYERGKELFRKYSYLLDEIE